MSSIIDSIRLAEIWSTAILAINQEYPIFIPQMYKALSNLHILPFLGNLPFFPLDELLNSDSNSNVTSSVGSKMITLKALPPQFVRIITTFLRYTCFSGSSSRDR